MFDGSAAELSGENFFDGREFVEPGQNFGDGPAVEEMLVELLADVVGQTSDLADERAAGGFCGFVARVNA